MGEQPGDVVCVGSSETEIIEIRWSLRTGDGPPNGKPKPLGGFDWHRKRLSITIARKARTKWVGRSRIGRFLPSATNSPHARQTGAIQQVNLAVSQAQ